MKFVLPAFCTSPPEADKSEAFIDKIQVLIFWQRPANLLIINKKSTQFLYIFDFFRVQKRGRSYTLFHINVPK